MIRGGTAVGIPQAASLLTGTTTNDSATAGRLGEFITATVAVGSAVSVTTATGVNITSISLTAGDWDVSGVVDYVLAGVTATLFNSAISLTTNTLSSQVGGSGLGTDPIVTVPLLTTVLSATYTQNIASVRVSLSATTTVYLVAQSTFSVGTLTAYGTIRARRVR